MYRVVALGAELVVAGDFRRIILAVIGLILVPAQLRCTSVRRINSYNKYWSRDYPRRRILPQYTLGFSDIVTY